MGIYVIWKFAENVEGAKKFLVDYVENFRTAFIAGEFYDFPCYPKTVSDLPKLIGNDKNAHPADKYKVLEDVLNWATNVGYPGYANAAIDEIYDQALRAGAHRYVAKGTGLAEIARVVEDLMAAS